jgi:hypothetical protein
MALKTLAKSISPFISRPMGISTLPRFRRARLIATAKADLVVEIRLISRPYALSIILILVGGAGEDEEEEALLALPAEPALPPKSRKRATADQLRQRASAVGKESELASYQRAISEEWWCKDPLCNNHDKGSCFIRQEHDHYVLTNDILTIWAKDLLKAAPGISLSFPGLTILGQLHSAGMAKRLAQRRAPRPETAMQTAMQTLYRLSPYK